MVIQHSNSKLSALFCLNLLLLPSIGNSSDNVSLSGLDTKTLSISGSCNIINLEITALQSLRKRWSLPACETQLKVTGDICEAPIQQCIPESLAVLQGKSFSISGPNCYNTVLKITGMYPYHRFVSEAEMSAFLHTSACRKVAKPIPGDIGVFRQDKFANIHAFLYMSPNLVFEKFGFDYKGIIYPMTLNLRSNVDYLWEASPECRRYGGPNMKEACFNKVDYYHCSEPLENNSISLKIRALEKSVESALNRNLNEQDLSDLPNQLKSINQQLDNNLKILEPHFVRLYREQLKSIESQLKEIVTKY